MHVLAGRVLCRQGWGKLASSQALANGALALHGCTTVDRCGISRYFKRTHSEKAAYIHAFIQPTFMDRAWPLTASGDGTYQWPQHMFA